MISFLLALLIKEPPKGAVLVIIDGFGESAWKEGNGIDIARTPTLDSLKSNQIYIPLVAAQQPVGLTSREPGSSSVGHQTLGLGRTVPSYYQMLEKSMNPKSPEYLYYNKIIREAFRMANSKKSRVHFAGLCTDTGVFSHIKFLEPMFRAASDENVSELLVHCFFDTHTTHPTEYLKKVESYFPKRLNARIATVHSAKTSMDKFRNWDQTEKSYLAIANGKGAVETNRDTMFKRLETFYEKKVKYDPFIVGPTKNNCLKKDDTIIIFNFREEKTFQIADRLIRGESTPKGVKVLPMVLYDKSLSEYQTILPSVVYNNSLGSWISKLGYKQLRTSESYKKYHISEFFSGGINQPVFEGEERVTDFDSVGESIVDKFPLMNASRVYKIVQNAIISERYKLIAVNFGNVDAAGHTGNVTAVKIAVECIDGMIKKIMNLCRNHNYVLFVTSDHGNGEETTNLDGSPMIDHTVNTVPFLSTAKGFKIKPMKIGRFPFIGNVASTILTCLGLKVPPEMEPSLLYEIDISNSFKNNIHVEKWFFLGVGIGIIGSSLIAIMLRYSRFHTLIFQRTAGEPRIP